MLIDKRILNTLLKLYQEDRKKEPSSHRWYNIVSGGVVTSLTTVKSALNYMTSVKEIDIEAECTALERDINKSDCNWVDLLLRLGDLACQAEHQSTNHFSKFAKVLHAMRSYILARILYEGTDNSADQQQQNILRALIQARVDVFSQSLNADTIKMQLHEDHEDQITLYAEAYAACLNARLNMAYLGCNTAELLVKATLERLLYRVEYADATLREKRASASPITQDNNPDYVCGNIPLIFQHKIYYQVYCQQVLFPKHIFPGMKTRKEAFAKLIEKMNAPTAEQSTGAADLGIFNGNRSATAAQANSKEGNFSFIRGAMR